ncbi:hypothetical protein [Microcoleus sp. BROC3]|uniref:hypothetical protein n=1 Tax=Microcoleus sp. BROC3 TaxID=3055323 RepID=UPI002FD207C7
MNFLEPQLKFAPNKPFYPLVCSYLAQTHGFIELISRGLLLELKQLQPTSIEKLKIDQTNEYNSDTFTRLARELLQKGVTPLIGDPQHPSHVDIPIKVNIESLGYELFFKHEKYDDVIMAFKKIAAGGLLIVAKEITEPDRTKDELWEFLRHCRNAAAHGGSFNFQNGEPKHPAKWRSLEIKASMQAQALFPAPPTTPGFINIGDVLYLLADIEAKFF